MFCCPLLAEELENALLRLVGQRQRGHRDRLAGRQRLAVGRFLVGVGQRQVRRAGLQHVDQVLREVLTDLHDRQVRTEGRRLRAELARCGVEAADNLVDGVVVLEVAGFAAARDAPVGERRAVVRGNGVRADRRAPVLHRAADVPRHAIVDVDVVELRERQVGREPGLAAVEREVDAAVVAHDHATRILRVDPRVVAAEEPCDGDRDGGDLSLGVADEGEAVADEVVGVGVAVEVDAEDRRRAEQRTHERQVGGGRRQVEPHRHHPTLTVAEAPPAAVVGVRLLDPAPGAAAGVVAALVLRTKVLLADAAEVQARRRRLALDRAAGVERELGVLGGEPACVVQRPGGAVRSHLFQRRRVDRRGGVVAEPDPGAPADEAGQRAVHAVDEVRCPAQQHLARAQQHGPLALCGAEHAHQAAPPERRPPAPKQRCQQQLLQRQPSNAAHELVGVSHAKS